MDEFEEKKRGTNLVPRAYKMRDPGNEVGGELCPILGLGWWLREIIHDNLVLLTRLATVKGFESLESLYGGQFNPVDKTNLTCYTPHRRSTSFV